MCDDCSTGQRSLFLGSVLFGDSNLKISIRHCRDNWSAFSSSRITFLFSRFACHFLARHLLSIISLANFANLVLFLLSSKYFAVFGSQIMIFLTFFHQYMFLCVTERYTDKRLINNLTHGLEGEGSNC